MDAFLSSFDVSNYDLLNWKTNKKQKRNIRIRQLRMEHMHSAETRPIGRDRLSQVLSVSTDIARPSVSSSVSLQAHQRRVRSRLGLHRTVLGSERHVQLGAHGQSSRASPGDGQVRRASRALENQLSLSHSTLSASRTTPGRTILRSWSASLDDGVVHRGQLLRAQALLHRHQQHTQWLRPSIVVQYIGAA